MRIARVFLIIWLLAMSDIADTISGKVIGVTDGDTITILDAQKRQHKIRLNGIDAPESNQAFGNQARKSLADLVLGKTVTVTSSKVDNYGQLVGKVMVGGRDIGLEQIRRGYAWFFRQHANELSRDDARVYEQAEDEARDKSRGLWSEPGPIPPWELRAAQRGNRPPTVSLEVRPQRSEAASAIIGDRNSMVYHAPNCPDYASVAERNREHFKTEEEAIKAGYRKARNCP